MTPFNRQRFRKPRFLNQSGYKSIGYATTNNSIKETDAQFKNLKTQGCNLIFQEEVSLDSKRDLRPQLEAAIQMLKPEDELVLISLHHLGNNQITVTARINSLQAENKYIRTLDGLVNTRKLGESGENLIALLLALSRIGNTFSQNHTQNFSQHRTNTKGNLGGRPKTNQERAALVLRLRQEGFSYRSIRNQTGLALSTIRRIILEANHTKP